MVIRKFYDYGGLGNGGTSVEPSKVCPITPRDNNVVIEPISEPIMHEGIILKTARPAIVTGIVKAVGPKVEAPIEAEMKVMYRHRNCVLQDELEIVNEEMIEAIV